MRIHTPPLETLQGWLASTQRAATWRWSPPPTVKCPLEALPPSWAARAGMSMMLVSALLLWCVELSRVLQLTASLVVPPGVSLYRLCKPWWEEMWAAFLLHGPLLWPSFLSLCLSVSSLDVSHVPVLLFFPSLFPKLLQSRRWAYCKGQMEWPPASRRAPMTFPAAATSPATMIYFPCVTALHIPHRHPQKAPAPFSRGHPLHLARTACRWSRQRSANFQPTALPLSPCVFN